MERLTKVIGGRVVFPTELVGVTLSPDNEVMYKILHRLAAYEDTGLEPEEIERIVDAYGRGHTLRTESAERLEIVREIKTGRLLRLSSAERDGRLVVLPCKVGAHVHGRYENWSGEVMEFSINSDGVHLYVRSGGGGFYCKPEDIEVEAALKGGDG